MDTDNQSILRQWVIGQYIVIDDDPDPSKCTYKPMKIDNLAFATNERGGDVIYALLTVHESGRRLVKNLGYIVWTPMFTDLNTALADAARQQKDEDEPAPASEEA